MDRRWFMLSIALCLAGIPGCGAEPQKVHEVVGRLRVGDQPAGNASIAFHPIDPVLSRVCPVGVTGADGAFRLTSYRYGDGAPAGEYIVTIIWPDETKPVDECECPRPDEHDRLRGTYASRESSSIHATIVPGTNEVFLQAVDVPSLLKELAGRTSQNETQNGVPD